MKTKKAAKIVKRRATIPMKYFKAVENGIEWLDLTFGRKVWLSKMDMTNFQIADPGTCVAGNVFRDARYSGSNTGYEKFLSIISDIGGESDNLAQRLGFNWSDNAKGEQYLQDIWTRRINRMQKSSGVKYSG